MTKNAVQEIAEPAKSNQKREGSGSKGRRRRQQIIDVSKDVLVSRGYDGLVLREIAKKIGIKHGNLQYYFPTKDDLLIAIFDQELKKFTDSLKAAVAATSTKRGRLAAIVDAGIVELKRPETALWRLLISLADHSPDLAAILKKENDLYQQEVAEQLRIIDVGMSEERRKHVARMIQAILDGFGIQYAYEDRESPEMRALESEVKVALEAILDID